MKSKIVYSIFSSIRFCNYHYKVIPFDRRHNWNEIVVYYTGPANVQSYTKQWSYTGRKIRQLQDLPSYIDFDNALKANKKEYIVNGKLHRLNGPAKIRLTDGEIKTVEYWINGTKIK